MHFFIDHNINNDTILDEIFQKQHFVQVWRGGQLPNLQVRRGVEQPRVEECEVQTDRVEPCEVGSDRVDEGEVQTERVEDEEGNHQTFDEFLVPVNFLTDDEDDELQAARSNVREYRKRTKAQVLDDEVGEQVQVEVVGAGDDLEESEQDQEDAIGGRSESEHGNSSNYIDSDDLGSYYTDSDGSCGEDAVRKPSCKVRYDPNSQIPEFCVGMIFDSVHQFRYAVAKYAVMKGKGVHFVKNEPHRVRAHCKKKCPWVLFVGTNKQEGVFIVKTYHPKHSCTRESRNKMATSNFLSILLKNVIVTHPKIKIKEIVALAKSEFKLRVCNSVARRSKLKILKQLEGDFKEQFIHLHDYVQEVVVSNPGSTCLVKSNKDNLDNLNLFERFYVCFNGCKQGWIKGCRPIIRMDGSFLKWLCKGEILSAIGRDGNNQMFPIAWAIVSVENKFNWAWFLRCLKFDLPLGDGKGYTIISDMQKVGLH